jgi:hypothetical protein
LGTVAVESPNLVHLCILVFYLSKKYSFFFFFFSNGATYLLKKNLLAPKDEFLEPPPSKTIIASSYKLCPSFGGQAYDHKLSTAGRLL